MRTRVELDTAGTNHMTFTRAVRVDGRDVTPELWSLLDGIDLDGLQTDDERHIVRLFRLLRRIPSEYMQYFFFHDEVLAHQRAVGHDPGRRGDGDPARRCWRAIGARPMRTTRGHRWLEPARNTGTSPCGSGRRCSPVGTCAVDPEPAERGSGRGSPGRRHRGDAGRGARARGRHRSCRGPCRRRSAGSSGRSLRTPPSRLRRPSRATEGSRSRRWPIHPLVRSLDQAGAMLDAYLTAHAAYLPRFER